MENAGKKVVHPESLAVVARKKRLAKEAGDMVKKYQKITSAIKAKKMYDKNQANNYHMENVIMLAAIYGDSADIATAKEHYVISMFEGDSSSISDENYQLQKPLYQKLLNAVKHEQESIDVTDVVSATSQIAEIRLKIQSDIEALKVLTGMDIPQDEKDAANEKIKKLEEQLEKITSEQVFKVKKKRRVHEKNANKKVIKTDLGSRKAETKPFQRTKGKPGRKVGWRKPIKIKSGSLSKRNKGSKVPSIYPAINVKSAIARQVGHAFTSAGIRYAIAGGKGKFTTYAIITPSQQNKAYEIYKRIADEMDVKVKKSESFTRV